MTQQTDEWEEVEVPSGTFISWADRPGQVVTGEVLSYADQGGTDFGGNPCPQLEIMLTQAAYSVNKAGERYDHAAGEVVTLNAGLANLRKAVRSAKVNPGDKIWLSFTSTEKVAKGTVKVFTVRVKRGAAEDEPPF